MKQTIKSQINTKQTLTFLFRVFIYRHIIVPTECTHQRACVRDNVCFVVEHAHKSAHMVSQEEAEPMRGGGGAYAGRRRGISAGGGGARGATVDWKESGK